MQGTTEGVGNEISFNDRVENSNLSTQLLRVDSRLRVEDKATFERIVSEACGGMTGVS